MRFVNILIVSLLFFGCNKPKSVLICGDHICVNKSEAKQYFEENLSLEVKILENDKNQSINLVEINMNRNNKNEKKINLFRKEKTKQEIKVLSNKEIKKIKSDLKKKNIKNKSEEKIKISKKNIESNRKKNTNYINKESTDICLILEKCNIDEISKYLIKLGKNKKFPDITKRE